jgi:hypothetical protein
MNEDRATTEPRPPQLPPQPIYIQQSQSQGCWGLFWIVVAIIVFLLLCGGMCVISGVLTMAAGQ